MFRRSKAAARRLRAIRHLENYSQRLAHRKRASPVSSHAIGSRFCDCEQRQAAAIGQADLFRYLAEAGLPAPPMRGIGSSVAAEQAARDLGPRDRHENRHRARGPQERCWRRCARRDAGIGGANLRQARSLSRPTGGSSSGRRNVVAASRSRVALKFISAPSETKASAS